MSDCKVCSGWILGNNLRCEACGREGGVTHYSPRLPKVTLDIADAMEIVALCGYSPSDQKALELVRMAWKKGVRDIKDKIKRPGHV